MEVAALGIRSSHGGELTEKSSTSIYSSRVGRYYDTSTHHEAVVDGRWQIVSNEVEVVKASVIAESVLNPEEDFTTPTKLSVEARRLSDGSTTASNSSGSPTATASSDSDDSDDEEFVLEVGGLTITSRDAERVARERGLKQEEDRRPTVAHPVDSKKGGATAATAVAVPVSSSEGVRARRRRETREAARVDLSTPVLSFDELCVLFDMVGLRIARMPSRPKHPTFSGFGASIKRTLYERGEGKRLDEDYQKAMRQYRAGEKREREVARRVLVDPRIADELGKARLRFRSTMGFDYGQQTKNYWLHEASSASQRQERKTEIKAAKDTSGLTSIMGIISKLELCIDDADERKKHSVIALSNALWNRAGC